MPLALVGDASQRPIELVTIGEMSMPKQEKLFRLSDEERKAKLSQLVEALNSKRYLIAERKSFLAGVKDQMAEIERTIDGICEDLGEPLSSLSPEMKRAREEHGQ